MVESFDPDEFLAELRSKGVTQAQMARALELPSSRIAEFYRKEGDKKRKLTMREGLILADKFGMDLPHPFQRISAEKLKRVLKVRLRSAPGEWSDRDVERLADELVVGLELLQALSPSQAEPLSPEPPSSDGPRPSKPA